MLARLDRGLEMLGPKVRRSRQDNHIHAAVEQLAKRVKADELPFFGNVHLVGQAVKVHAVVPAFRSLAEHVVRNVELVTEQIRHRPEFHRFIDTHQRLGSGAGAASAAAD